MLKIELRRGFRNSAFLTALSIGLIVIAIDIALGAGPKALAETWEVQRSGFGGEDPTSFFASWIGLTPYTITSTIFYYALPLVACIPYATSLCEDLSSRFASQLVARANRAAYFSAKSLAVFLTAGATVLAPLVVDIVVTACLLPQITPDPTTHLYAVLSNTMLADLFYANPWAYIMVFLALAFLGAGIFGLISTTLAFFTRSAFIALFMPFALCAIAQLATQGTVLAGFAPINVLTPAQPAPSVFWIVVLCITATLVIALATIAIRGAHFEELS